MGRGKSNMELIKKEKLRDSTFQQKSNTLKKKVNELATLCDIKAVVIIYGPKKATAQAIPLEPEIWPHNRDEVLELINKYKGQSPEDRKTRTRLISHFFHERIQKAQQALTEQRNVNVRSKYPTEHSRLNSLEEEDLRKIVVSLEDTIGNAKAKLEQMKANNINRAYQMLQQQQQQQQQQHMIMSKKRKMDSDAGNQASKHLKIDLHQAISGSGRVPFTIHQQRLPVNYHNWNQMMFNFGDENSGGTSNIVHNAPPSTYVYNYPMMAGTLDSIRHVNNFARIPPYYYGEGRQPIAHHVMEYRPMTEGFNSHQMVAPSHQYYEDGKWRG